MKRNRCSLILVVAITLLATAPPAPLQGQGGEPEQGGAAFLLIPVGSRAAGLGQAAAADLGSEAVFWNPAGIARATRGEVGVHHAATFVSDNTALTAIIPSRGLGVFALTAYLVDFGSQELNTGEGTIGTGKISPKNVELLATFATEVGPRLNFGVSYKLIQFRQDCSGDCGLFPSVTGTTHGVDIGAQFDVFGRDGPLRIGAAIQHAGFKLQLENQGQADPLPTRLRVGIAYRIVIPPPSPDVQPLDARFLFDAENKWGNFSDPDLRVGVELGYGQLIRLRTGYGSINEVFSDEDDVADARGPSVGVGVQLGRVSVDFSRIFFDTSNFDEPVYITLRADL